MPEPWSLFDAVRLVLCFCDLDLLFLVGVYNLIFIAD